MEDPNLLNYDFVWDLARICFPPALGLKLIDWGCASGRWVRLFREVGMDAIGFDLSVPHTEKHLFEADLRTFRANSNFDFATCSSVLLYFNMKEVQDILKRIYGSFTKVGFIFTPNSEMQPYYVPSHWGGHDIEPSSFPSEVWLRDQCELIGGHAYIMNFRAQIGEQNGPSILWVKDLADPLKFAAGVARKYREAGYKGFTISI